MTWTLQNTPSQKGKLAIVTGASGGLGLETARGLAALGADIVIAARDPVKAHAAIAKIGSSSTFEQVDLGDLASIAAFAGRMLRAGRPIDILVNNAGLAAAPKRALTRDGFELQVGINFLGHFALTGKVLSLLREAPAPRVIAVSSLAHRGAKIDFDNLMSERSYAPMKAYGVSKLADLIFARELQRRSDRHGWGLLSVAAHPGLAMTELTKSRPGQPKHFLSGMMDALSPYIGQSAIAGAIPLIYAATAPEVAGGEYYGPDGFMELKGKPKVARSTRDSRDLRLAERLWRDAEHRTGVVFESNQSIDPAVVSTST